MREILFSGLPRNRARRARLLVLGAFVSAAAGVPALAARDDILVRWPEGSAWHYSVALSKGWRFAYKGDWNPGWGGTQDPNVYTGDFNGDGKSDLLVRWNDGAETHYTVAFSTGSGFSNVGHWLSYAGPIYLGGGSDPLAIGDFNGDGKADVLLRWYDGATTHHSVLLSTGSGFSLANNDWLSYGGPVLPGWGAQPEPVVVGDFNGDGRADILLRLSNDASGLGQYHVLVSTGSSFSYAGNWQFGWGDTPEPVYAGDFNGDRRTDILVRWFDGATWYYGVAFSNGSRFQYAGNWNPGWGGTPEPVYVGDFNGDGKADILLRYPDGGIWHYEVGFSTGATFQSAGNLNPGWGWSPGGVFVGNFNGADAPPPTPTPTPAPPTPTPTPTPTPPLGGCEPGSLCRGSTGACDPPEYCTAARSCPADVKRCGFPLGATPYAEQWILDWPSKPKSSITTTHSIQAAIDQTGCTTCVGTTCGPTCRGCYTAPPPCMTKDPANYRYTLTPKECGQVLCTGCLNTFKSKSQTHSQAFYDGIGGPAYPVIPYPNTSGYQFPNGSIVTLPTRLQTLDRIGFSSGNAFCPTNGKFYTDPPYLNGPESRQIFPGEITPDGYGFVPASNNWLAGTSYWNVVAPAGYDVGGTRRGNIFFNTVLTGVSTPSPPDPNAFPEWGGGAGPGCDPAATLCVNLAPRARFQFVPGRGGEVLISGVATSGNVFQDAADVNTSLRYLAGQGSPNPTTQAIENYLRANGFTNYVIYGHSLGALDAAVLYHDGFGSAAYLFALPGTGIAGTPAQVAQATGGRPLSIFCNTNDPVCKDGIGSWRGYSGSIFTTTWWWTQAGVHDRYMYQRVWTPGRSLW